MSHVEHTMSVGEFYRNRNVLITGATGFLGKALLEKLLRSCEDIGTVYVLIRPKKGNTVEERLHNLLSQDVFKRLHTKIPFARNKVVAIEGDLADPNFSLAERDKAILENVVSAVFHSAATVKFDEEIKYAVNMNVGGTKHMVDLAKNMKNLKAFVYISTAYSNCDKFEIEEKYYPQEVNKFWRDLLIAVDKMGEEELNALTPRLIGGLPNTYTFTKQVAESLVYDHKDQIPLVIFRPSIVTSAFFEPYPGWVDNLNGVVGVLVGFSTGISRMALVQADSKHDYIGVDYVVNAAIAAAWRRSQLPTGECKVYNCTIGKYSPTGRSLLELAHKYSYQIPMEKKVWKPRMTTTTSFLWFQINFLLFSVVPAFIIDVGLKLAGIQFSMVKVYRKAYIANKVLSFFGLNTFDIRNDNIVELYNNMSPDDQNIFSFDLDKIPKMTEEFVVSAMMGIKKYLLKEDMSQESFDKLQRRAKYYDFADMAVRSMFVAYAANIIFNWLNMYFL